MRFIHACTWAVDCYYNRRERASDESVQDVFKRAGEIGGERHSRVRTLGMEDMTQADLDAQPRSDLKLYAAADFLGFYYVNIQTFPDVCRAEGVDIATYVRAFKVKHAAQFARADEVTTMRLASRPSKPPLCPMTLQ